MLNTLFQSGNLLRYISLDSCQGECLFLILERYTRFALLNNHSFIAPIGVLLNTWLHFQHWMSEGSPLQMFSVFFFYANRTIILDSIYLSVKRANCFASSFFLFYVNSVSLNTDTYMSNPLVPRVPRFMCSIRVQLNQPCYSWPSSGANAGLHTQFYCVMVLIIFR